MPFFKQKKKVERPYEDDFLKLPCCQYRSVLDECILVYWEKGKKKEMIILQRFGTLVTLRKL